MSPDRGRTSVKGHALRFLLASVVVAAAAKASQHPTPRKLAKKAVDRGRAWSNEHVNRGLQAPTMKSQGERWRAINPDA